MGDKVYRLFEVFMPVALVIVMFMFNDSKSQAVLEEKLDNVTNLVIMYSEDTKAVKTDVQDLQIRVSVLETKGNLAYAETNKNGE